MHETHYLAIFLTLLFIIISYCLLVLAGGHFEVGPKTFLPIYFHLSHFINENYDAVLSYMLEVRFLLKLGLLGLVLVYSRVIWSFGCIYGGVGC